jgi:hypothetical protein
MQHRPHCGHQILFAKTVSNLQPDEHCDGLLPHTSIFLTKRLSAHIQSLSPRAAMQQRPRRDRQLLCAEAVPNLQPDERTDGLLPHRLILRTAWLFAHATCDVLRLPTVWGGFLLEAERL